MGNINLETVHKIASIFCVGKQMYEVGDRVRISNDDWKELGFFGRSGQIVKILGRGWYSIHFDGDLEDRTYNFFVGETWSDFSAI